MTEDRPAPRGARGLGVTTLRKRLTIGRLGRLGILLPFTALFIALSLTSGPFLTTANLFNILDQQSSILIVAAAGTLVLVAGGIDLSVGAVYSLAAVTAARLALQVDPAVGILAGIGVGLLIGFANGIVVTAFRINSLIATLAMSFMISGLGSLVTGGNLIVVFDRPSFGDFAGSSFLSVRSSTWVMLIAVTLIGLLLARTVAGRHIYAVGGNREAARLAGVRVNLIRLITFGVSGGAAGIGGVIGASRVLSAQASSGQDFTFTVLAGIVVGGTSILGGEGAVWRTVVGVLFIALIGNGFNLLGLDPLYRQITLGVIILLAVGIDAWLRATRR